LRQYFLLIFQCLITAVIAQKNVRYTSLERALENPQKVYHLNLERQDLTGLPAALKQFSNLQELHLSLNNLEQLPPEIGQLSQLEILTIKYHKLRTLPAETHSIRIALAQSKQVKATASRNWSVV